MQIQLPPPTGNPALDTWLQRLAMQVSDEIDDNIKLADGKEIYADVIRARNGDGLWLQDDGGNGIEITDGGIWHSTKQSGCSVYLSANQSYTSPNWAKVNFDTENYDIQNEFDSTTNYRFTVSEAGKYLISGYLIFYVTANADHIQASVYKNGAVVSWGPGVNAGSTDTHSIGFTVQLQLAANDYIEIFARNPSNNDTLYGGGVERTCLQIAKIA